MKNIKKLFAQSKVYCGYLTAGDGGIEKTFQAALALIAGGVNLLEIGVPFSDPIADGAVIQAASERALQHKITWPNILWLVREIRKNSSIPLVLFSYLNPILQALPHDLLPQLKASGINGLLIVDCPLEESALLRKACVQLEMAYVYVISSNTPIERIKKIAQVGSGFLYYVSRNGTTGMCDALPEELSAKVRAVKKYTHLPVIVGFGISNRKMVQQVLCDADGVVVGSLFIDAIANGVGMKELTILVRSTLGSE